MNIQKLYLLITFFAIYNAGITAKEAIVGKTQYDNYAKIINKSNHALYLDKIIPKKVEGYKIIEPQKEGLIGLYSQKEKYQFKLSSADPKLTPIFIELRVDDNDSLEVAVWRSDVRSRDFLSHPGYKRQMFKWSKTKIYYQLSTTAYRGDDIVFTITSEKSGLRPKVTIGE